MIEQNNFESPESKHNQIEKRKREIVSLATELNEKNEVFSFPGISPEAYLKRKESDVEYPEYSTPTDELIKRFETEGMKVVFGDHPESGNVFALPLGSNDIMMDSIPLRQLQINETMSEGLRELISAIERNRAAFQGEGQ